MNILNDLFSLADHTAIVAGGAGAIGSAMSKALLKAGANVIIWSRSDSSLAQVRKKLTQIVVYFGIETVPPKKGGT